MVLASKRVLAFAERFELTAIRLQFDRWKAETDATPVGSDEITDATILGPLRARHNLQQKGLCRPVVVTYREDAHECVCAAAAEGDLSILESRVEFTAITVGR
jgi:hypothetical protein